MNDVTIFENAQFGQIRTSGTSEQPLFCLADVCKVLELQVQNTKKRLNEKGVYPINTLTKGGEQQLLFVNEQNLYKVIMRSDKPQAEAFQDWVCGEVLPSIRKSGGYIAAQPDETPEMIMARALKVADETMRRQQQQLNEANTHIRMVECQIEEQQKQIDTLAPKAEYAEHVLNAQGNYTVNEIAKELHIQSAVKLYATLKERGILYKQGDKWLPCSKFTQQGFFATRTIPFFHKDGSAGKSTYTVVTERGRQWLHTLNLNKAIL